MATAAHSGTAGVGYGPTRAAEGDLWRELRAAIAQGARSICDVGGGARPLMFVPQIERFGLDYLVVDVSRRQLELSPPGYQQAQGSILDRSFVERLREQHGAFDVVVSRWCAEHLPDGRRFHENVFELLRPGGVAIHMFPTLYSLPFVVNRLLPSSLSAGLLFRVCPDRGGKFRPYYSWCRGPSARQLERLRSTGFEIERYTGYFGHAFYKRIPPLAAAHARLTRALLEHPHPSMTSFALVVLRRPA